jgi:putative FmdB family regulatory protein
MPIFNFTCQDCGTAFEEWVRSSTAIKEVSCPNCDGGQIQKMLSRVAGLQSNGNVAYGSSAPSCSSGST